MAMTASGRVGPDTRNMVIMVRSDDQHSVAMAMVAVRARRGPVSGSQRIRRPVVARVAAGGGDRDGDQREDGDGGKERDQAGAPRAWVKQQQPPDPDQRSGER